MPVKSRHLKKPLEIKVKEISKDNIQTDTEDSTDLQPAKIKKGLDYELPEPVIADEKPEVDPLLGDEESEESIAEEASLDDDELNPFGDKWEQ
jgi:hypothetical protein